MRLIAISTSSAVGSVALMEGDRVLIERAFPSGILHGQALVPMLAALMTERGWGPKEFSVLAVDIGPGSYTGCRVGLAAAKILARGTGAMLVGVPSLEAIARQAAAATSCRVGAALDARRGRLYAALYRVQAGEKRPVPLDGPRVVEAHAWAASVPADLWAGDGAGAYPDLFPPDRRSPPEMWRPMASSIAHLAAARAGHGEGREGDDPYRLEPLYLAATEAEEKFRSGGRG